MSMKNNNLKINWFLFDNECNSKSIYSNYVTNWTQIR